MVPEVAQGDGGRFRWAWASEEMGDIVGRFVAVRTNIFMTRVKCVKSAHVSEQRTRVA